VPVNAFIVKDRGVALPARVSRLPLAGADLTVIVDVPSADAARLPVVQGAISDFAVHLPAQVRLAIVPAGATTSAQPTTDRAAAQTALRAVQPEGKALMGPAISPVLGDVAARPAVRSVVVVVSARSRDFGGWVPNLVAGRPTVYALVTPAGANSVAAVAALKSSGTATQWRTPDALLSALDDVTADVAGQYQVEFESDGGSGSVEIAAEFAGIRASTVITVPAAPSTATPTPSSNARSAGSRPAVVAGSTAPVERPPLVSEPRSAGKGLGGTLTLAVLALVAWFALIGGVALYRQRREREAGFHLGPPEPRDLLAPPHVIDLTDGQPERTPDRNSSSRPAGD
jgi:hypothetical protein